ncbi:MAG TPA: DUF302 domain-containing protein [Longimicrobiales bacterium]|nr:DUF302 domain-containing protein [Longimicrobiales bacterium]
MSQTTTRYALQRTVSKTFAEVDRAVREALQEQGFGVLTEIDVKATLKKKLDVDFRDYEILGACNPPLAHAALQAESEVGLLLPCNVVVRAGDEPGTTVVEAMDPVMQLEVADNPTLPELAQDVRARLERVLDRVAQA